MIPSQGTGSRDPAGVAAHDLNDFDFVHCTDGLRVETGVTHGGGNPTGHTAVTWCVVGVAQVVINGLGHAHAAHLITGIRGKLTHAVRCVHRVIAADVEEVMDVVGLEDFENPLVIFRRELVAAGTQRRGRGPP